MVIDQLSELAALVLAVSLATERLVVVVKTMAPKLGIERPPKAGQLAEEADRPRRLLVLLLAYLSAFTVGALIATDSTFPFSVSYGENHHMPVPLLALLASGGSALWTSLVGIGSAVKDIRQGERREMRSRAEGNAPVPVATGTGEPTFESTLPRLPR